MAAEISQVLQTGNYSDVKLLTHATSCVGSQVNNERIFSLISGEEAAYSKILFLVSACHARNKEDFSLYPKIKLITLEQCFELILNKEIIYHFIQQGYYIITNGWLRNYEHHITEWGFHDRSAKVFFRESLRKILFLDTGIDKEYLTKLKAVSEYMGLAYEIFPVGLSHCRNFIEAEVSTWRAEVERTSINEKLARSAKENADYFFMFQQLKKLVDYTNETSIINEIFSLLNVLFAPQQIGFQTVHNSQEVSTSWMNGQGTNIPKTPEDFLAIEIAHQNEVLGVFEIYGIRFPQYIDQYRNAGIVISKICGVAITNARKYQVIQEQKEQLGLSEKRYRKLFEEAPLGIALIDSLNGKIYEVNTEFAHIAGRTMEEMKHIDWMEITHPDEVQGDLDNMALLNAGKISGFQMEKRFLHSDGTPVWINMAIAPIQVEEKAHPRHLCMIEDITDRKQAEETLHKLSAAVEQSPVSIVITDVNGNIEYGNPKVFNLTGYSAEELVGKNPRILKTDRTSKKEYEQLWDTIKSGHIWLGEFLNKKKNGELYWENAMISPIMNESGQITHFMAIKEDITERKQAEMELGLLNDQLRKLNFEKDKFFSIIAHDLRGPFNGFLGLIQIMTEEMDSLSKEDLIRMSRGLEISATNLFRLLENLLYWARMQQGLIPFNPISLQLLAIIDESAPFLLEQAKMKVIDIAVDISADLSVFADSNMLQTIIRNLVSNALKFTHKGGKVTISASTGEDNHVVVAIKDTGIGMSSEMAANLFRLDVQTGRPGTDDESSSGLGLLLCKEFVEKHGGKILVESEEGKGSTFSFSIPGNAQSQ